jgi:hypothetical protein
MAVDTDLPALAVWKEPEFAIDALATVFRFPLVVAAIAQQIRDEPQREAQAKRWRAGRTAARYPASTTVPSAAARGSGACRTSALPCRVRIPQRIVADIHVRRHATFRPPGVE